MSIRDYRVTCLECQHEWNVICIRPTERFPFVFTTTHYPCPKRCPKCNSTNIQFTEAINNI